MSATAKKNWANRFYWIGVTMTLACFALVLTGNTDLLWRFEHKGFPLSWMCAGVAVLAFLVAEFGFTSSVPTELEERTSPLAPEFEAAEF
jgi:hypothetical protein